MSELLEPRIYYRDKSIVFLKTKEQWGGLSNMAGGFVLEINQIRIPSSEALYQACRFPHLPNIQHLIIKQHSPMTAKMISKHYLNQTRLDWEKIKINVMRWCLKIKLAQHWDIFRELLLSTEDMPIVEQSYRDIFWGAKLQPDGTLLGINILGRLLVELRQELRSPNNALLKELPAPNKISNFLLLGHPFETDKLPPEYTHNTEVVLSGQSVMSIPLPSNLVQK